MNIAVPLLHDFLSAAAARLPAKVALICGNQRLTYSQLDRYSTAFAATLASSGITRAERVVIFADNTVETAIAFWGSLKANAVVSIINPLTKADKLIWLLKDCRATALVTDAHLLNVVNRVLPACSSLTTVVISGEFRAVKIAFHGQLMPFEAAMQGPGAAPARQGLDIDLAALIYTSGSTGDPKGVMLTHRNMLTAAISVSTYLGMREEDIVLNTLPFSFDYGLYQMIMSFRVGATLVLERSFAFPGVVLNRMVAEKVTGFPGVPTIFAVLAGLKQLSSFDLSSIRYVTNTASALAPRHIDFLVETFPQAAIFSMYGLTECHRCTYLPPRMIKQKSGSVGIAIPNTEIWVEGEHGERLGPGLIGEIVIRGATVMRGYWEKPEQTARKLKPGPLPGEQVLHTGDLGRLDEDGYLYFVGRTDDIIKSRGEKIAPREVENVLYGLREVLDAAVIGVADDVLGSAVKAFVVLHQGSGLTKQKILAHCQAHLENFMVPKYIEVVADLPKTSTGKIKKTDLR